LHSQTLGTLGELKIRQRLLEMNYNFYIPEVDIFGVDLIAEMSSGAFKRVQIKTLSKPTSDTAIQVRCVKYVDLKPAIDVIAVYYAPLDKCAFVPYNNEKMLSLALTTAKNNQTFKRQWFYQYERFPEFS
tara:strand:- start:474 stop:863 length:390 start_codon:yes stop_codon:yes gene_type:complete